MFFLGFIQLPAFLVSIFALILFMFWGVPSCGRPGSLLHVLLCNHSINMHHSCSEPGVGTLDPPTALEVLSDRREY
jgi:hypothetical protein